jgi:hypothetical protein
MRSSISYIETKENNPDSANKNKNKKQKQMYFLICSFSIFYISRFHMITTLEYFLDRDTKYLNLSEIQTIC